MCVAIEIHQNKPRTVSRGLAVGVEPFPEVGFAVLAVYGTDFGPDVADETHGDSFVRRSLDCRVDDDAHLTLPRTT